MSHTLLTLQEFADEVGVCVQTVRNWGKEGGAPEPYKKILPTERTDPETGGVSRGYPRKLARQLKTRVEADKAGRYVEKGQVLLKECKVLKRLHPHRKKLTPP